MSGSNNDSPSNSPRVAKIEWKQTPLFKQFSLKLSEVESLVDKAHMLGLQDGKGQDIKDWSKLSKAMIKKLVESKVKMMLTYGEINYHISMIKNKDLESLDLQDLYERSLQTLNIIMIKLGMEGTFSKVKEQYDNLKKVNLKESLIKMLIRCKNMLENAKQMQTIFKNIQRRETFH
mmetsp:Transcript_11180/g.11251  ORF Transcript_11180/g.11251 Transcript_11180/m.11251 type:complete len:176 (-) Transcript_11180:264-791(-)